MRIESSSRGTLLEMDHQLAQLNIARLRAPIDDPLVAEFVEALEPINQLAERSPGFVWRLQTEEGDATSISAFEDEQIIVNLTVWESVEALSDYVYRSGHVDFMRRRREWFERLGEATMCLWWIPSGSVPTIEQATDRLDRLRAEGPTPAAFSFRRRFGPNGEPLEVITGGADS